MHRSLSQRPQGAATIGREVDTSDLQPASVERGPYQVVEHGDLRALLRQALQTLPVTLRTAVILRDLHELSYQEIADQLGLPEGTVSPVSTAAASNWPASSSGCRTNSRLLAAGVVPPRAAETDAPEC